MSCSVCWNAVLHGMIADLPPDAKHGPPSIDRPRRRLGSPRCKSVVKGSPTAVRLADTAPILRDPRAEVGRSGPQTQASEFAKSIETLQPRRFTICDISTC